VKGRLARVILGGSPRALLLLLAPTGLAILLDAVLRARTLLGYAPQGKAIYGSSLLISAALWALPLWCVAWLLRARGSAGKNARLASAGLLVLLVTWVFPLATFGYGGQALYHRVFHSYMGRDTLRLGIALRGTVADWFVAWGSGPLLGGIVAVGALVTLAFVAIAKRQSPALEGPVPALLVVTFMGALGCLWFDLLDSRYLQAATPDTCFAHGVVHAARVRLSGQGWIRKGVSLRSPAPLPALTASRASGSARPTSVLVILTESVRADALCSDPRACHAPFLDAVVPDRVALGNLTSQTPNTFSAFLVLTTGLAPNVDFASAHTAPVLWELAHAVGYRTAYISAQNPKYEDFGTFVERAGIDALVTGTDLGGMAQEQIGAPDERAAEETLRFIGTPAATTSPYFAVLHLSNTHAPYRIDADLQPFLPSAADGLGDVNAFHNRYRNSVRLQERTIAAFLQQVRALPGWDDTAVIFLSDHGEQFREHGGLFHNHSLYDEELRVPGWIAAGASALSTEQKAALASYAGRRTYAEDVHATLVDLLGLHDSESALPEAKLVFGRSLLRPWSAAGEPSSLLATSTAVWEPDDARYGVMRGDHVLVSSAQRSWVCFDLAHDPGEHTPLDADACGGLLATARSAFAGVDVPP
jgi:glucan phosphoethanolaminetransferase (alkaline phosphatase superfamily)